MLEGNDHDHAVHEVDGIIENRVSNPPVYFTVLFYGLIIWGVAFAAFYLLSGWSSEAEFQQNMAGYEATYKQPAQTAPTPPTPPAAPAGQPAAAVAAAVAVAPAIDAAALYSQRCAMCHGAEAKGGIGPDLTEDEYKFGRDKDNVILSIAEGRPSGMPGFANQLSKAEIAALADYLIAL